MYPRPLHPLPAISHTSVQFHTVTFTQFPNIPLIIFSSLSMVFERHGVALCGICLRCGCSTHPSFREQHFFRGLLLFCITDLAHRTRPSRSVVYFCPYVLHHTLYRAQGSPPIWRPSPALLEGSPFPRSKAPLGSPFNTSVAYYNYFTTGPTSVRTALNPLPVVMDW